MLPWVHPSQPPKQHLDRFSRFAYSAAGSPCFSIGRGEQPPKFLPLPLGRSSHPFNSWFLESIRVSLQFSASEVTTIWRYTNVYIIIIIIIIIIITKRYLDRFCRFCRAHERDQLTDRPTDRQTDHANSCVAVGRYH